MTGREYYSIEEKIAFQDFSAPVPAASEPAHP